MKFVRYQLNNEKIGFGYLDEISNIYPLPCSGYIEWIDYVKNSGRSMKSTLELYLHQNHVNSYRLEDVRLLVPIQAEEVWAAGVTYEKSKEARNYESNIERKMAETFYDKVYDAKRPELFLKSTLRRTVGPNEILHLRSDSNWQVPEPELGLILGINSDIIGFTVGNDLSCRDIEGENPLYLPQAKVWSKSCAIGPYIVPNEAVSNPLNLKIDCRILRNNQVVFQGAANTATLKRTFEELVYYLTLDNDIVPGTVLLTGTCIIPPHDFTLHEDDQIEITIEDIGVLTNNVKFRKITSYQS